MEKKLPMWKPIKMGDRLPCQSFFRKKDGEILKLSSVAGVKVGQDGYYLPVDEVIEEIRNFPIDESEDEKIRKAIIEFFELQDDNTTYSLIPKKDILAWLEKQGEHANFLNKIQIGDNVTRNQDGVLVNLSQLDRVAKKDEKYEQKPAWSEEDERIVDNCIEYIKASCLDANDLYECIDWLKSLRPQNQWKPSEEQMENLSRAFNGEVYRASLLMELYQDLKKLKE